MYKYSFFQPFIEFIDYMKKKHVVLQNGVFIQSVYDFKFKKISVLGEIRKNTFFCGSQDVRDVLRTPNFDR